MAGVNLSARFEQIPEQAKAASDEVRAAAQSGQDELRTAASAARRSASAAADGLQNTGPAEAGRVSPHWQEIRAKWRAHVAALQSGLDQAGDDTIAAYAVVDADIAESYAQDAIDFAAAAIEEAESAAITAIYWQTRAKQLNA
jgi:hypothetical protein